MKWHQKIWLPKRLLVVFPEFQKEKPLFNAVLITKKQLHTREIGQILSFASLDECIQHYGPKIPLYLHLLGSGILTRKVNDAGSYREDLIINGDVNDFFFSTYSDGSEVVASFFRKTLLEDLMTELQNRKIKLIGVSAGYASLFSLLEDESLTFDMMLEKKNGMITKFERSEKPENRSLWCSEFYELKQLAAFSVMRLLWYPDEKFENSKIDQAESDFENTIQYNKFKTLGLTGVGTIFLALVINYFYTNSLNNTIAQLETDLSASNQNLALLDRLEQEKSRKEQLVLSAGVNSSKFLSYYLDEIGQSVPKEINLSTMEVFPVTGKLKNKQKVEVDQEKITITGSTAGNEILDDWIEKMNRFEWIKSVELTNYLKTENGQAAFNLVITLTGN